MSLFLALLIFAASLSVSNPPSTASALSGTPRTDESERTRVWPAVGAGGVPSLAVLTGIPEGASSEPLAAPTPATRTGTLGYALPRHGSRYLAIPEKRGTVVTICGPAACLVRASTDVGPDLAMQRAGRIADVSSVDFPVLCGKPLTAGLCSGSYTVGGRLHLPDTSTR